MVGGGYKYCQLGEGNCFLRFPTGLQAPARGNRVVRRVRRPQPNRASPSRVGYDRGDQRFAGATYDPTSHYRAAEVFDFFAEHGLDPDLPASGQSTPDCPAGASASIALDSRSVAHPIATAPCAWCPASVDSSPSTSPHAGETFSGTSSQAAGVLTDFRASDACALGPAPYLSDAQLEAARSKRLAEAMRTVAAGA